MRTTIIDNQYGNVVTPIVKINGVDVSSSCIKIGTISYNKKASLLSSVATCSIELDSTINATVGHSATIQASVNGAVVDFFSGIVAGSDLDPTTKTVNISLESSRIFEHEITAQAKAVDYPFMVQDGPNLPIVFGSGVKYPVGEAFPRTKLTLQTPVGYGFPRLCLIDGGEQLTQGSAIDIMINGIVLNGIFNGNEFTITDGTEETDGFNRPFFTNLSMTPVEGSEKATLSTGECIVDMYVYIPSKNLVNYCYKQAGHDCYFLLPWSSTETLTISETSYCQRANWGAQLDLAAVGDRYWVWSSYYMYEDRVMLPPGSAGSEKTVSTYAGKNIVNIMPDTEVVAVYGFRDINGLRQLCVLPTGMYTVENIDITGVGTCTSVTIWPPLSVRPDSPWTDEIIVTTRSPVDRTPTATAQWICDKIGATLSGSFPTGWNIDCVLMGTQSASQLLDTLAYETCTPLRINGTTVSTVTTPGSVTYGDDSTISKKVFTPNEFDLISQFKSEYRLDYHTPMRYYTKKGSNPFTNEQTHTYLFITNKDQVYASTDWWFSKLNTANSKYSYTLVHKAFNIDPYDLVNTYEVENISYDLIEPKVELSCNIYIAPPSVTSVADPALDINVTIFVLSNAGTFGEPTATEATQGQIWDGNIIAVDGSITIYGCRTYTGSDITREHPNALPSIGEDEEAGAWSSGVNGICRVKTGVDRLGRSEFVLAYSPSIPYWLVKNQAVILGSAATVDGKKIYSISWGA